MRARRALLYVPGDDPKKVQKAASLGVDCICLDMEDGVAVNRKDQARSTIVGALKSIDFHGSEVLARINPVGSGLEAQDLSAVLTAQPDGIVVPKIESADEIVWASQEISTAERLHGWQSGSIVLIAGVETAKGILNMREIASADPRLEAIIFGAEDFASDVGAQRSSSGWEVFYARSAVVTHSAAFGLQAIDMVYVNYKDTPGLTQEALQGAQMGFSGKQVIHPDQVEPVQLAFTPSEQAIAHAVRVVEAFHENQRAGKGAFVLDGKMVDMPVVRAAQRVLSRARDYQEID